MPFRAGAPFLLNDNVYHPLVKRMYQCPLGLMLHFYSEGALIIVLAVIFVSMPSRADAPFLRF